MSECAQCESEEFKALPYDDIRRELCNYSHGISLGNDYIGDIRVSTVVFPHHGITTVGVGWDNTETIILDNAGERTRMLGQWWHSSVSRERAKKVHDRLVRFMRLKHKK